MLDVSGYCSILQETQDPSTQMKLTNLVQFDSLSVGQDAELDLTIMLSSLVKNS